MRIRTAQSAYRKRYGWAQAQILIAKLFEIAKHEVVIVSGHLTDENSDGVEVYGHAPVITAAKKFLQDSAAKLSIILQDAELDRGNENRLLRNLAEDPARKGKVRVVFPTAKAVGESTPHFMVSDRYAYRFEQNPVPKKTEAIANFGDPKNGKTLAAYFDVLLDDLQKSKMVVCDRLLSVNEPLIA